MSGLTSEFLRDARIVVIGAGCVGAALSYRLAQAGAKVTTVERRFPGSGTSGSSFAWLNGFGKTPKHYHRLNIMGIRDHQDLADELNGDWVHLDGGMHWVPEADEGRRRSLTETVARLREWGVRLDRTTPEIAMRELEPDLWIDPAAVADVYVVPREGWLDTVVFAHGVTQAAGRRYGARLEHATVTGLRVANGAVSGVTLDDGRELPADVVVNAAGPEAARIGALAGVRVPIERQIGMFISTAPAPVRIRHVVRTPDVHTRPDGGGRVLLHPDHLDSHAVEGEPTPVDAPVIQATMALSRRVVPGLAEVPAQSIRVGIRPVPVDGHPIVGFEPGVGGLYTVVTHSGVTLSARLALLVTEELSGGDAADLAPYRPTRFVEAGTRIGV